MTDTTTTPNTDRVAAHLAGLHAAVTEMITGTQWQAYLAVQARFRSYSFWNTIAIITQRSDATHLAGFRQWQALGRQVRRGEKGIAILAPILRTDTNPDDTDGEGVRRCVGFKVVYVFDVAQTDGDPLPEPPMPAVLDGDAPTGLLEALAALVTAAGFGLTFGAIPGRPDANGVTNLTARTVTVRADLSDAQQAKTCAHELAHVLLHHQPDDTMTRAIREVEAESVAYLVCEAHGLRCDDYSFPYLAHWSGGDPALIATTADRVTRCAATIVDQLTVGR